MPQTPPTAEDGDGPQLYLVTPSGAAAAALGPLLAEVLDRAPVACLRIRAGDDAAELGRLADMAREIAHARDIAVLIEDHIALVQPHGLDGVHLTHGARGVREARKLLGPDAIVGAFCGASRHEGMTAGEAGADYVSFGPVGASALSPGETAPLDLFAWWSEMIEVPVVAEGAIDAELIAALRPVADFIALGPEIWGADDPAAALAALWLP
ncbi:thiamine phosphate synthase [Paracoccus sp. S-4012]|uniref:thiamine phosphate synthase n=1 Tax=Paracoccus sp. S-4012 TaxID=2665648 RepID=UPI0012AF95D0|nr:thiamine phosphate synthase [Paracoccus sp. S-4012]MRX50096.1 thiamine phosphate synthase [Paracoccus sp. S-4012]